MKERGLTNPTRTLPTNFLLPLLTHAIFEEDDDLQETWARLLVNAGDSATDMDLRTAYVDILAGMSAFDVRNLSLLGAAALSVPHNPYLLLETWNLPKSANPRSVDGGIVELAPNLAISLGNLARLGCVDLNNSPIFAQFARMTHLGMALYGACR